jgi:hypothetical protein
MIILIASMSMLGAFFVANIILGDANSEAVTVKTADPITKDVNEPEPSIFREDAINPTVEVFIGEGGQSSEAVQ